MQVLSSVSLWWNPIIQVEIKKIPMLFPKYQDVFSKISRFSTLLGAFSPVFVALGPVSGAFPPHFWGLLAFFWAFSPSTEAYILLVYMSMISRCLPIISKKYFIWFQSPCFKKFQTIFVRGGGRQTHKHTKYFNKIWRWFGFKNLWFKKFQTIF